MEETRKKIETKAYEYFVQRGMVHGNDVEDWLKAEKEVLNENLNRKSKKSSKKF